MNEDEPDNIDWSKGRRGAIIPPDPNKVRITIRLDPDILEWFKQKVDDAGGGNYQTQINDALRQHIEAEDGVLEARLRKVLREELARAGLPAP